MTDQKQLSFMLDAALYRQSIEYSELGELLDSLLRSGIDEFRVKLILNETNIVESITENNDSKKFSIKLLRKSENFLSIQLSGEYGRKNRLKIGGRVLIINHPIYKKVWVAITDASNDFFKKPFRYFLRTIHPRSTPLILTTPQIEQLLTSFQVEHKEHNIRVKQLGQRTRINSNGAIKSIETDRRWTDLNISEAFSEAREAGQWMTDIYIEYGEYKQNSALKVGRYGEFLFKDRIKNAFDLFISQAAKYGETRYNFLNNRQRSKENNFTSNPFYISFNYSVFGSKEQFQKLSLTLRKIPSTSFTTLHSNPYFHASLVDYKDGSSYELVIMSSNYLTIIPQGRATVRSLQKLCSHIFSNFREGTIVEEINAGE